MNETSVSYSFGIDLDLPMAQAIAVVTAALKEEGFGVLTTIDVQQTMKQKLDLEIAPYTILGACNPTLAHRALEIDAMIGLLLPCNVVVRQDGDHSRIDIADPIALLGIVRNQDVQSVADEAGQRLRRVLVRLKAS